MDDDKVAAGLARVEEGIRYTRNDIAHLKEIQKETTLGLADLTTITAQLDTKLESHISEDDRRFADHGRGIANRMRREECELIRQNGGGPEGNRKGRVATISGLGALLTAIGAWIWSQVTNGTNGGTP